MGMPVKRVQEMLDYCIENGISDVKTLDTAIRKLRFGLDEKLALHWKKALNKPGDAGLFATYILCECFEALAGDAGNAAPGFVRPTLGDFESEENADTAARERDRFLRNLKIG